MPIGWATYIFQLEMCYIDEQTGYGNVRMATKKRNWRQEQEAPMDGYHVRLTAAHARHARKKGKGNVSAGVRQLIEEDAEGFVERRHGPPDRRKK